MTLNVYTGICLQMIYRPDNFHQSFSSADKPLVLRIP